MSTTTAALAEAAPLDFSGKEFGDTTILRLLATRDRWGGRQWEGFCKCGRTVIVSTGELTAARKRVCKHGRTIAEVELATGCLANGGIRPRTVRKWLKLGMLTEGQLVDGRLPKGADCFREKVQGNHKEPVIFCRPDSTTRCLAAVRSSQSSTVAKKRWAAVPEVIERRGRKYGRAIEVLKRLDITDATLSSWDQDGWPNLEGEFPGSVTFKTFKYYDLDVVNQVKIMRATSSPADEKVVSVETMGRLLGCRPQYLKHPAVAKAMGLVPASRRANIDFKRRDGESRTITKKRLCFTRDSARACLIEAARQTRPPSALTVQEATSRLREASPRSLVFGDFLRRMCVAGLVDSVQTWYKTATGPRYGRLIWNDSVEEALVVLRRVGWDNAKAIGELQRLRDERVAANGGQPPASRLKLVLAGAREAAVAEVEALFPLLTGGDGATMTPPTGASNASAGHTGGQPAATAATATSNTVKYPDLGIEVNFDRKTIIAHGASVDLERSAVQWHIFRVALEAFPEAFSIEAVEANYPGELDEVARRMATMHLNKKLARLKLEIFHRRLRKTPE